MRQVCDGDPVPPRQLNPAISKDLETICLKCLEKDPSRRYGSAVGLADDLRRYLRIRANCGETVGFSSPRGEVVPAETGCRDVNDRTAGGAWLSVSLPQELLFGVRSENAVVRYAIWLRRRWNVAMRGERSTECLSRSLSKICSIRLARSRSVASYWKARFSSTRVSHANIMTTPTAQADMISILPRVARIHILLENPDPAREYLRLAIRRLKQSRIHNSTRRTQTIQYARLYEQLGQAETLASDLNAAEQAARRAIELLTPDHCGNFGG